MTMDTEEVSIMVEASWKECLCEVREASGG
jgi:hypothetical protein